MSNPRVEEYEHNEAGSAEGFEEVDIRQTIVQIHKREIENLRAHHRQHRMTLLESNQMIYVSEQESDKQK